MVGLRIRDLMLALSAAFAAGTAQADFVFNLSPPSITAPAVLPFSNARPGKLSVGTVGVDYNFVDRWDFTLAGSADVSSLVAAFRFDDPAGVVPTFGISNLQVSLLDSTLSTIVTGWQTVTPNPNFTVTVSMTPETGLVDGNYSLQVRGMLLGLEDSPAAYSGSLIAAAPSAVPLPAALPLLVVGLGLMGVMGRRRLLRSESAGLRAELV